MAASPETRADSDLLNVAKCQQDVNYIFCEACASEGDKPFREFDIKCVQEKNNLVSTLVEHLKKNGMASMLAYARLVVSKKNVNPDLMQAALAVFLTHSQQAQDEGIVVPPLAFTAHFRAVGKRAIRVDPGTLKGPEVLSYFREDYDLNQHHHHWHVVYPFSGIPKVELKNEKKFKRTIFRQGELFLYMHTQMIARYNAELLAWDMDLVHSFDYDESPLQEYVPPDTLSKKYTSRSPAGQGWHEIEEGENSPPSKSTMMKWRDSLMKAILNGSIKTKNGENFPLTEENATNTVGMLVEAIAENVNYLLPHKEDDEQNVFPNSEYGSLHNSGHRKFAAINRLVSKQGVMGDTEAAIRDYIFWVWHRHIDDFRRNIVRKYQYSPNKMDPKAEIIQLELLPRESSSKSAPGEIGTYLGKPDETLHEVNAKLGHEPYKWKIKVKSTRADQPSESNPQKFTVRLFIVPRILLQDHFAWIEMDKFSYTLEKGEDTILRDDSASSVAAKVDAKPGSRCSCGWPQTMMLPLGKTSGMDYVAFAILTDDILGNDPYTPALSFCGAQGDEYPDCRGMGYPFDHLWTERVTSSKSVEDIIKDLPHAKTWDFKIKRIDPPSKTPKNATVAAFENRMRALKLGIPPV